MKEKRREMNYYDVFIAMIECSQKASVQLHEMLTNFSDISKKADQIHDTEHEADSLLHDMMHELNRAFITPIDREDIMSLAGQIDSITDGIEDVANLFDMLSIDKVRPEAVEMSKLIVKACDALALSIREFKSFKHSKSLNERVIEVNRLEEVGDKLHRSIIKQLYLNTGSAVEIMKWKEIYDTMEAILDLCEDVADLLEGIAVKNS